MPWPVLLNQRRAGKLPVYIGGWIEDFHDPHNWAAPFLYSQGSYGRVINMTPEYAKKYDELVLKGAAETDPDARRKIYEEIQLDAEEDAVVVWMYQNLDGMFFQKWIKGFYFNPAHQQASYAWIYALTKEQ
jgi:peptide/nickel transport system substrate-binding protein